MFFEQLALLFGDLLLERERDASRLFLAELELHFELEPDLEPFLFWVEPILFELVLSQLAILKQDDDLRGQLTHCIPPESLADWSPPVEPQDDGGGFMLVLLFCLDGDEDKSGLNLLLEIPRRQNRWISKCHMSTGISTSKNTLMPTSTTMIIMTKPKRRMKANSLHDPVGIEYKL